LWRIVSGMAARSTRRSRASTPRSGVRPCP
jgi:hypothetical protein